MSDQSEAQRFSGEMSSGKRCELIPGDWHVQAQSGIRTVHRSVTWTVLWESIYLPGESTKFSLRCAEFSHFSVDKIPGFFSGLFDKFPDVSFLFSNVI